MSYKVKLCPFLRTSVTIHNTIHDARVPHIGLNAIRDNDVVKTTFEPCIKEKCMAYNTLNNQCNMMNNTK